MCRNFLAPFFMLFCMGLLLFLTATAHANSPVRDSEIEDLIQLYAAPIFKAANLDPKAVNIIVIDSPQVNAFVAGGQNIFIYTGLILETETPLELASVIAHEVGHIEGGHLVKLATKIEESQFNSLLSFIISGVVGFGAGSAEGGVAASQAAQAVLQRSLLSHIRVHENAADQASLRYLKANDMDFNGAQDFFEKLYEKEGASSSRSSEYARTHPLTYDRIETIRAAIEQDMRDYPDRPRNDLSEFQERHDRIKAKIFGYSYPKQTGFLYGGKDTVSLYAQTMSAFKDGEIKKRMVPLVDQLIAREPNNPYFHEIKGHGLFNVGALDDAIESLYTAISLKPNDPLLDTLYAHALIETKDKNNIERGITSLYKALQIEPRNAFRHRLISIGYGYLKNQKMSDLHLAQYALQARDFDTLGIILARFDVHDARDVFDVQTPQAMRLTDLRRAYQEYEEVKNKKR